MEIDSQKNMEIDSQKNMEIDSQKNYVFHIKFLLLIIGIIISSYILILIFAPDYQGKALNFYPREIYLLKIQVGMYVANIILCYIYFYIKKIHRLYFNKMVVRVFVCNIIYIFFIMNGIKLIYFYVTDDINKSLMNTFIFLVIMNGYFFIKPLNLKMIYFDFFSLTIYSFYVNISSNRLNLVTVDGYTYEYIKDIYLNNQTLIGGIIFFSFCFSIKYLIFRNNIEIKNVFLLNIFIIFILSISNIISNKFLIYVYMLIIIIFIIFFNSNFGKKYFINISKISKKIIYLFLFFVKLLIYTPHIIDKNNYYHFSTFIIEFIIINIIVIINMLLSLYIIEIIKILVSKYNKKVK